jgi:hypothetical protein
MAKPKKAKKQLTPAQKKFSDISAACRTEVVGDKKLGKSLFKKIGACVREKYAGKSSAKKSARKGKK